MASIEDLVAKLQSITDEMSEYAYECLLEASKQISSGDAAGQFSSRLMTEEKAVTRARRSVEKAVSVLESLIVTVEDGLD